MAGEVGLGLGYIELAAKDRGAARAVHQVTASLKDMQGAALRASSTVRPAVYGVNEAFARMGTTADANLSKVRRGLTATTSMIGAAGAAAAGGAVSMKSMATSAASMGVAFGSLGGPIGAVVGLVSALSSVGLAAWLRESAAQADSLAASMKRMQGIGDEMRKGAMDAATGGGVLAGLATGGSVIGNLRETLGDQNADPGSVRLAIRHAEDWRDRVQAEFLRARLDAAYEGPEGFRDREGMAPSASEAVIMQQRRVDHLRTAHAIMKQAEAQEDPRGYGTRYEKFVGEASRSFEELKQAEKLLTHYRETLERANAEAVETQEAIAGTAREMAEAFEAAAQAAAATRQELARAEQEGQRLRDRSASDAAESFVGRRQLGASLDVLRLRAIGADTEADALERRQRFDELRRRASPEMLPMLDEQERLESVMAMRRQTPAGGSTTDLMSGLRAIQAGVFSGGQAGAPEERTAKATQQMAEAAKRTEELQKRAVKLLEQLNQKDSAATLG